MADVFSKRPIDFSKYRELLSDDNPKIPDDQISRDSYKQNQGDSIGSSPVGNVPQNETKNPSTLDQKNMEDSQQLNAQPRKSLSSSRYKPKRPNKEYRDNIHRLLDQVWEEDMPPRSGIDYDYRHLLTSQSVLRNEFPDANILDEVDIKVRGPDEVPFESRHRALYHFLCKVDMTKCGVDPAQAWNDYGRLTLAEKQLDLARRARGPDLDLYVILKKDKYNKLLKELKEKTEEIEELSERLSKFESQELIEGDPNFADLRGTPRPTRLGEMYSQLFDDEWSEAFEALKNIADGNEDDDIFPNTLFILQNIVTEIFKFCQSKTEKEKIELEDGFAVAFGLKQPKVIMIANVEEELDRKPKMDTHGAGWLPKPTPIEHKPLQPTTKEYIKGVLKFYEKHPNYDDALKEYTELLTAKDFGMLLTHGPVVPFKEELVTDEEKEYKPNLAGILLTGCKERVKNYSLAWREYTDFIKKHKKKGNLSNEKAAREKPTPIEHKPLQPTTKEYIKGVLKFYEKHPNYDDALKEYTELLTAKDFGMLLTHGPVVPFKEELVTDEEKEYKPNLAGILLTGCKERVKNYSLAWREYTDFIKKHKKKGNLSNEKAAREKPTPIEHKPLQPTTKEYIKGVLKFYEKHPNYDDALKEYTELLTAKDFGMLLTHGPVVPFKEELVTDEEKEYKPNLAGILLTGYKERVKNCSLAWREYTDFIKKHKKKGNLSNEKAAREKAIQREIARTTEEQNEDGSYRRNPVYPTIERHAREIRKALAATSAKTKSRLFIDDDLPFLIPEKVIREDARIMLYVQNCLELCWYMRMQDPPMVIVTPTKGEEVDKTLFSFHGRRGKTVEVCVWPALLLHENGSLVCKGYVLPEKKRRK
uniref:Uncharacterized protein LOC111124659 isoform X2 n=1 Tax=Crassostrea virginica TaxID=6565 RepID=A0A8B8D5N1_CRAVI|nr:uncharacterized protein LOC111124659 isoform X2 [Crassostrea virginica]